MPLAQLERALPDTSDHHRRPAFRPNLDGLTASSPARVLQERLEATAGGALAASPDRWSPRSSLALIVTTSFALWGAILVAATQAVHAIA